LVGLGNSDNEAQALAGRFWDFVLERRASASVSIFIAKFSLVHGKKIIVPLFVTC
jgi:hypothetical protein